MRALRRQGSIVIASSVSVGDDPGFFALIVSAIALVELMQKGVLSGSPHDNLAD